MRLLIIVVLCVSSILVQCNVEDLEPSAIGRSSITADINRHGFIQTRVKSFADTLDNAQCFKLDRSTCSSSLRFNRPSLEANPRDPLASDGFEYVGYSYVIIGGWPGEDTCLYELDSKTGIVNPHPVDCITGIYGKISDIQAIVTHPNQVFIIITVIGEPGFVIRVVGEYGKVKLQIDSRIYQNGLNKICGFGTNDGPFVVISNYDTTCDISTNPKCSAAVLLNFDGETFRFAAFIDVPYTTSCAAWSNSIGRYALLVQTDRRIPELSRIVTVQIDYEYTFIVRPLLSSFTVADETRFTMNTLVHPDLLGVNGNARMCNVKDIAVSVNAAGIVTAVVGINSNMAEDAEFPLARASLGLPGVTRESACTNAPQTSFTAQWEPLTKTWVNQRCLKHYVDIEYVRALNLPGCCDLVAMCGSQYCNFLTTSCVGPVSPATPVAEVAGVCISRLQETEYIFIFSAVNHISAFFSQGYNFLTISSAADNKSAGIVQVSCPGPAYPYALPIQKQAYAAAPIQRPVYQPPPQQYNYNQAPPQQPYYGRPASQTY